MDVEIVSLIRAIGILQGLVLGIILIVYSKKNKSTLFLGLFLLGFSIEFLPGLVSDMQLLKFNARQLLFMLNLSWIIFPLMLIYVSRVSIIPRERVRYRVLYPGILAVVLQLILGIRRDLSDWVLNKTYIYELLYVAALVYSGWILYRIYRHLQEHKEEVRNQYSHSDNRLLAWVGYFAFFCFALILTRVATLFMGRSPTMQLIMAALKIVIITVIALTGFFQFNVINVMTARGRKKDSPENSQVPVSIPEERAMDLLKRMDDLIEEKAMFRLQDLTIADVARELGEHPRTISIALNTYYKKNFNSYINQYRIRQAETLLRSGYTDSKSIEGLSQEVGFRSKASFYKAFKENTGITPVEYVRKLSA